MIPMAYGPPCETFHFAWRNERFVLAAFQLRPGEAKRSVGAVFVGSPSDSLIVLQPLEKAQFGLVSGKGIRPTGKARARWLSIAQSRSRPCCG
jgi:hypothetical protein